jgi:hypothetical protein
MPSKQTKKMFGSCFRCMFILPPLQTTMFVFSAAFVFSFFSFPHLKMLLIKLPSLALFFSRSPRSSFILCLIYCVVCFTCSFLEFAKCAQHSCGG